MPYRIIAIDGGPQIAATLRVLRRLETANPGFLALTDHFVGGSSGGITALYMAARLSRGDGALAVLDGAEDMVRQLFECFSPANGDELADSLSNLLVGASAMIGNRGLKGMLREQLGEGTLGELKRRVSIISTSKAAPYEPQIWSNFGPGPSNRSETSLVEAGMNTSAFPFWVPVRSGQLDGCMWTNAGGAAGLSAALAAAPDSLAKAKLLDEAVVLHLGANDGMSSLSNRYLPGMPAPEIPDPRTMTLPPTPISVDDATEEGDLSAAADYALIVYGDVVEAMTDRILEQVPGKPEPPGRAARLADEVAERIGSAEARLKAAFRPVSDKAEDEARQRKLATDAADPRNESWGWSEWVAYLGNPAFIFQQWLTSLGRGSELTTRNLIGDRSLRVGPVTFLGTNVALLCVTFGLLDAIYWFADLSTALWANEQTSERFAFAPNVQRTQAWLQRYWMEGA